MPHLPIAIERDANTLENLQCMLFYDTQMQNSVCYYKFLLFLAHVLTGFALSWLSLNLAFHKDSNAS